MAQEQLLVRDHVPVGAVIVVVHGDVRGVGAAQRLGRFLDLEAFFDHLALEVEVVHVDFRPLFQRLAPEVAVDAFGGDPGVANGGSQQVRLTMSPPVNTPGLSATW